MTLNEFVFQAIKNQLENKKVRVDISHWRLTVSLTANAENSVFAKIDRVELDHNHQIYLEVVLPSEFQDHYRSNYYKTEYEHAARRYIRIPLEMWEYTDICIE